MNSWGHIGLFLPANGRRKITHSGGTPRGTRQGEGFTRYSRIPTSSLFRGATRAAIGVIVLALAAMLALGAATAQAQTTDVCSDTPGPNERIDCVENLDGVNLEIDARNVDITTVSPETPAVFGWSTADSGNVDIAVTSGAIRTEGIASHGVFGLHHGTGDLEINVRNVDITTTSTDTDPTYFDTFSIGVRGRHEGTGEIDIDVRGGSITTKGVNSVGILGGRTDFVDDDGSITILADNVDITTEGTGTYTNASGGNVTTSHGIFGSNTGIGDIGIDVRGGSTITTMGVQSHGIFARRQFQNRVFETLPLYDGNIDIDVQGGTINTMGVLSRGIHVDHLDIGNININVRNATIVTQGTGLWDSEGTYAHGIQGRHSYSTTDTFYFTVETDWGNVTIDVHGGSITTHGAYSYGVRGDIINRNIGGISIATGGGNRITTTGANAHGIVAYHWDATQDAGSIMIDAGGRINTSGAGAQGIRVGALDADDALERVAPIHIDDGTDEGFVDGHRRQIVMVNGPVRSKAEGVFLAGGGRVVIGRRGSIVSESGVAILATGDTPGADPDNDPPIKPKLYVDLNPGGRRVAQVIGDDWIVNDGGETTIAVNNTVLHEGATGLVLNESGDPVTSRNGAWNVRMRAEGVTVNRGDPADPDPANWAFTEPAAGVVADRDFSAGDFRETRRRCPRGQVGAPPNCATPPPPMCPEGQVGTPPDCMTPPKRVLDGSGDAVTVFLEGGGRVVKHVFDGLLDAAVDFLEDGGQDAGESSAGVVDGRYFSTEDSIATPGSRQFHEVYAPRAALYEALPGFLLRLNGGGPEGKRLRTPGSPVWARLSGSTGSHAPERSTVGQEYDFERLAVEAGLEVAMGEHFAGSISVRHVSGSAKVSAPTGGGEVEAEGLGVSIGAAWRIAGGYYANGSLSLTDYDVDVSSGDVDVGTLKRDAAARGALLSLEAGRRIEMSERMNLTPRAWATRSEVSIDKFTDSAGARFSHDDAARLTGGVGVVVETARAFEGGTLSLRGSVDLAQTLDDAETTVDVSGERLESKASKTRLLFGLGGVYRKGRFSVSGEVSMGGLGSGDTQYAGRVSIGNALLRVERDRGRRRHAHRRRRTGRRGVGMVALPPRRVYNLHS